jgi:hypothetical protein
MKPIRTLAAGCALSMLLVAGPALAQSDDARDILHKMSDYVAGQKHINLTFDADVEVITPQLQKIQFASSGALELQRPDKLVVDKTGGYADLQVAYDGKTLSVLGRHINAYAQVPAPATIDALVGHLHDVGIYAPGADLLLGDVYAELSKGVIEATHIGRGVVDGVECEHLAFRNQDIDWQLWVEVGATPVPRKYVITSKAVGGAPQYTLRIKSWKTDGAIAASSLPFTPPASARKVDLVQLGHLDDVPEAAN